MRVALALAQSGLRPQQLELEITESVLLKEAGEILAIRNVASPDTTCVNIHGVALDRPAAS
jgi:EAL domain-containing protein (putative c-di-GMP-specific phosphodiesterase class I)